MSATAEGGRVAEALVADAIASLSPRLDPYVFGRGDDDWRAVLGARLGERRLATIEVGTGGYLGLLLGASAFLVHAEQDVATDADAVTLATDVRTRVGAEIGLAAVAHESGDDMRIDVGIDIEGETTQVSRTAFRGGEAGRRRSANAAAAELWRRLGD